MKIKLVKIYSVILLSVFLMGTFYSTIILTITDLHKSVCMEMCEETAESEESKAKLINLASNILEEEIKHKCCIKDHFMFNDHFMEIELHLIDRENLNHQHHIPPVPTPPPDFC